MRTVWVLISDYGCGGLQEPVLVFETEEACNSYLAVHNSFPCHQSLKKTQAMVVHVSVS